MTVREAVRPVASSATALLAGALERHGVPTEVWFDRQLSLAVLGGFVQLGWNKVDDPDELAWWADQVPAIAQTL